MKIHIPMAYTINIRGELHTLDSPWVMGIINLTPDSFYKNSRTVLEEVAVKAENMLTEGADILDLGAYSSRPGAEDISEKKELERLLPAIEKIKDKFPDSILSIDTFRAQIAHKAIEAGADIINDISGGVLDNDMFEAVSSPGCPYIMMHMKGTPQTMKSQANYQDLIQEVYYYFTERIELATSAGIKDIIIDPGFGFSKTIDHNFELLRNLSFFKHLGYPILAGLSRKSTIYKTLGILPEKALNGTTFCNTIALQQGINILRVHDVKAAKEVITLNKKLNV